MIVSPYSIVCHELKTVEDQNADICLEAPGLGRRWQARWCNCRGWFYRQPFTVAAAPVSSLLLSGSGHGQFSN